jgi:hypothetical protein
MYLELNHHQRLFVEMKLLELDLIPFLQSDEKRAFLQEFDKHEFRQYTRRFRKLKKKISRKLSIGYKILDERFVFYLIAHMNDKIDESIHHRVETFIATSGGDVSKIKGGNIDFLKLK